MQQVVDYCGNGPEMMTTACSAPNWMALMSALLVPAIACFGAWIACQQWITARNRLKLDLFDRRLAIYEAAREYIVHTRNSGRISDDADFKFLAATRGAIWLLNKEIACYLDNELRAKAGELHVLEIELDELERGEERSKNVKDQRAIKNWLGLQLQVLEQKFTPFLKLQH